MWYHSLPLQGLGHKGDDSNKDCFSWYIFGEVRKTNKLLFGQWNDNKVGCFSSTWDMFGISTIQCRVEPEKCDIQIPESLKWYILDRFMGGVDNVDKDKCICGSFTGRAMFKKWYHMGLMGVFDFMIVNGRQAWNNSTKSTMSGTFSAIHFLYCT